MYLHGFVFCDAHRGRAVAVDHHGPVAGAKIAQHPASQTGIGGLVPHARMMGRNVSGHVGDILRTRGQCADLGPGRTGRDPIRLAGDDPIHDAHKPEHARQHKIDLRLLGIERDRAGCGRAEPPAHQAADVLRGVIDRSANVGRAPRRHEQDQGSLGALPHRVTLAIAHAGQGVAVEAHVIMARLQRTHHGFAGLAAHHVENLRAGARARTAGAQAVHHALRRNTVIAEQPLLRRIGRGVHHKARHPASIGRTALRAAPIGKRSFGQDHRGQLLMADPPKSLEYVEQGPAGRLLIRALQRHLGPPYPRAGRRGHRTPPP